MFYLFLYWLAALLTIGELPCRGSSRTRGKGMKGAVGIADRGAASTSACNRCPAKPTPTVRRVSVRAGERRWGPCVEPSLCVTGPRSQSRNWVGGESCLKMSISTFSRGDDQAKGRPTHWFVNSRVLEGFLGGQGLQKLSEKEQNGKRVGKKHRCGRVQVICRRGAGPMEAADCSDTSQGAQLDPVMGTAAEALLVLSTRAA